VIEWLTLRAKNEVRNLIGKIAALIVLGLGAIGSIYKAGKYANGGEDITKGTGAAVAYVIGAAINGSILVLLYLEI